VKRLEACTNREFALFLMLASVGLVAGGLGLGVGRAEPGLRQAGVDFANAEGVAKDGGAGNVHGDIGGGLGMGGAEELLQGLDVLPAGAGAGVARCGDVGAADFGDGGGRGGAQFGGGDAFVIVAHDAFFDVFGLEAGAGLGLGGVIGLEAAHVVFAAESEPEEIVFVAVAGGIGRELAAVGVAFEQAEAFALGGGFRGGFRCLDWQFSVHGFRVVGVLIGAE
jgi:hypothetical protein